MISAYCLGFQNWTVIPRQIERDFKDMVSMGFEAVCLSFSESEMEYARRTFEIQVNLAKKCGLKVFVVPSRLGGRFAGAPLMPSLWVVMHPEHSLYTGGLPAACLEAQEFREWIKEFMKTLLTDYNLDGIVWDEPKYETLISNHPATIKKYGASPTVNNMIDGFVDFIDDITSYCGSLRPGISQTLFNQATNNQAFTQKAARLKCLEYFGYDGAIAGVSKFKETPELQKKLLKDNWQRTVEECAQKGKKTFALVENMLMPQSELGAFEKNFDEYIQLCRPEHLSVYYYAHNNENPEAVQKIVKKMLKKYISL